MTREWEIIIFEFCLSLCGNHWLIWEEGCLYSMVIGGFMVGNISRRDVCMQCNNTVVDWDIGICVQKAVADCVTDDFTCSLRGAKKQSAAPLFFPDTKKLSGPLICTYAPHTHILVRTSQYQTSERNGSALAVVSLGVGRLSHRDFEAGQGENDYRDRGRMLQLGYWLWVGKEEITMDWRWWWRRRALVHTVIPTSNSMHRHSNRPPLLHCPPPNSTPLF